MAALNSQLGTLNNQFKTVDPRGFQNMARAAKTNSDVFRNALASTGKWEVQQVRLNSATDEYVRKLKAQKLGFRELWAERKRLGEAAYKEQLAMENMMVRKGPTSSSHGRDVFDVAYPRAYAAEVDTAGRRLAWFNETLKSGSTQMVNWGKNTQWAGRQLTVGLTMPVAMFGAAAGVMAYQVDKELTRITKVYDTTADSTSNNVNDMIAVEKELQEVRRAGTETAIQSARDYGFAVTDTLKVQAELAATGQTGADLQKATSEVMRISRLGEMDAQETTKTTIALQQVFKQSTEELTESFNYMNSIENATSLATQDFAAAIPIAAAPVKAFGGDIQELGVLLTAMKSQGIEATQGANAIKAAMQRLGRPSKQVQEEWKALTGTDITQIFEKSESLTEIFQNIASAVQGLSDKDRIKAFAGLFGTYQVTRMSAMVDGLNDINNSATQVGRAFQIAQQDSSSWAKTAENEVKRYQESISGQWERAWQSTKAELAKMGEPFVELATVIVKVAGKILSFFNGLGDNTKKVIAIGVALGAIAGPALMLAGLFGNLFGNMLKGVSGVLTVLGKFTTSMQINTKESRIAAMAAKFQEQGYISQTKALQALTIATNEYAAAQRVANTYSAAAAAAAGVAGMGSPARFDAAAKRQADEKARAQYEQNMRDKHKFVGPEDSQGNRRSYYMTPSGATSKAALNAQLYADIQEDAIGMNNAMKQADESSAKTAKNAKRIGEGMRGAAVASGAMAAGMALTMFNSEGTANSIGQFLILSSVVVPAASLLLTAMKGVSIASIRAAAAQKSQAAWTAITAKAAQINAKSAQAGAIASYAGAVGTGKLATATSKAAGMMGRVAGAAGAIMGPVGWTITAITAIGFGIKKWFDHVENVKKEQAEFNKVVNHGADVWADKMGIVRKEYEKIGAVQEQVANKNFYMRAVDSYSSDDMKEFINNMKSLEGDDLALAVKDQFVTLQTEYGLTAEQASDSIRAMYEVMGRGSADAEAAIASLMDQVGQMDSSKMADALKFQADVFFSKEAGTEEAKDAAKDIAKTFTRAMADANQSEAAAMFSALKDTVSKGWTNAFNGVLTEGTNELNERLREFGINSGSELAAGLEKYGGSQGLVEAIWGSDADPMVIAQFRDELDALTGSASAAEKAIIKALAADIPGLDDNIDSMREFEGSLDALAYTAKSWDGGELTNMMNMLANPPQGRYFDEIVTNGTELQKTFALANDEQRLAYANTILLGRGLKQADTMAEAVKIAALGIRTNLNSAAGAARNLANSIAFSKSQVADMMKSSMGAVQSMIADDYRDAKEEQWDKQMESTQNYWDNYVSNVNADIDRQKKGLENKWEKRKDGAEKYWDNRVKAIEKTIDAEEKAEEKRQKMFDAEIARIQRLTDMANTNIDFNIALNEGNLDEAAKIANDIEARSMQWAYEDAAAKSADKSEKRQDKLSAEKDRLEESRDAAMDAMAKREEQEKAHLDKISDMRQKAAEADRDAAIEAKQQEIDNQKKMLDEALRIFTSGTAAEQKEMKKRMEQAGLSYDWFENNVIKPKGTTWGKYFGDELHRQLKLSADQIKNDNMWSMIGDSGISAMAKSMGFAGKNDLMHFLKTGEIKGLKDGEAGGSSTNDGKRLPGNKEDEMGTYHTGGEIGGDKGGRKGVARTLGGLHNSEMMVRAQKGEYMINRDAAKKYGDILPEINSQTYQRGHFGLDRTKMPKNGVGGEPGQGPAPFFAAAILRGIQKNIMNNLKPIVKSQKKQQSQGLDGSLDLSGWGQKSGRFYKAADPGKGWSNTHDYRNGLKSPLYAIGSGTVSAVTYGPGAGSGEHPNAYPRGYGSYGVLATLQTDAGPSVKYAHLWPGSVKTGRVEGGEQIALSASTGNSSGPHTHFEVNGSTNAQGIFAGLGIPLFKGAQYVNYDNTLANLHKGEAVLTKDINSDFHRGVENFANGSPGDTIININGYDYSMEALANMVVSKMEQRELRKPQSRTIKNRTSN